MREEKNDLLYGFKEPLKEPIHLTAGPFSMIYENGFIRYISYAGNEIIRIVYMALRDKNWGTYPAIIEKEKITSNENSFDISHTCRHEENYQTIFTWDFNVRGYDTGKIVFSIKGKAIRDLLKNRAGFCVLHPIKNTAGEPLTITHTDGSRENAVFPSLISPENPFKNMQQLEWTNQSNQYQLVFGGDSFEMEDHRNWTDTSYKTFCTPLSNPFPVQLNAGDTVSQEIIFSPLSTLQKINHTNTSARILISTGDAGSTTLPLFGLAGSTETEYLQESAMKTIAGINPDFYGIDIRTSDHKWRDTLKREIQTALHLNKPFIISLQLTNDYKNEFALFKTELTGYENSLHHLLIIQEKKPVTEQPVIDWAALTVKNTFPDTQIGIGTYTNFTEINRNRKKIPNIDFVGYAIHPQEHAFDHLSMIENLEAQSDTVISTRNIYPSAKVFVASLTLRRRCNPNALDDKDRYCTNDQKADPRQVSLWGAGWALGSLKQLSESGAYAVNCFQTVGRQGVCNDKGEFYPVGLLLKMLLELNGAITVKTYSSAPLTCSSFLLEKDNKRYLFLANHSGREIDIELPYEVRFLRTLGLFPSSIHERSVNASRVLRLLPYEVMVANN